MMKSNILFFVLGISFSAHAQWSGDPTVNTPICAAAGNQYSPSSVSDGSGGAIITWEDYRNGGSDIYVQRVDAIGVVRWTANGVAICTAASDQSYPIITSDGSGGAIITWVDARSESSDYDIYAQRINTSGSVEWTANGVAICIATANIFSFPAMVSDGSGGAIITWVDARSESSAYDIYAQRINTAGAAQWTANGVAICTATNNQLSPTIVSDGSGGGIITWVDFRNGSQNDDIYAQRINLSGVVVWGANGVVICTATDSQQDHTMVSDGSGGAIITWRDRRNVFVYDIYAQRINATGAVLWTGNGAAISTATGDQLNPTIASDDSGGAIIIWEDTRNGITNSDIYAQRINGFGAVQWTEDSVAICTATEHQYLLGIISDGSGGAVITWEDRRNGSGNTDIYAQRTNASGAVQWTTNGVATCTATGDQKLPKIIGSDVGGSIITWQDNRSGTNQEIYAQRVNDNGTLGGPTGIREFGGVSLEGFSLDQNYPNPFNPATVIKFSIPVGTELAPSTLNVFDVLGREVATLVNDRLNVGSYEVTFNAQGMASGVYFYRLQSGSFSSTQRMLLTK